MDVLLTESTPNMSTDTAKFQAYCDLEIFGDINMSLSDWVAEHLKIWLEGLTEDEVDDSDPTFYLNDFAVTTTAYGGAWGLAYVQFWIITPVPVDQFTKADDIIQKRINHMMGDTVNVRFIKRIIK